jgi:hypothetical protein
MPPIETIKPVTPPPDTDRPTTAMLKADIDSGRTGDKNPVFDPGLSPLGTDDEAAGHPPSAEAVALARKNENSERWMRGSEASGAAHKKQDGFPILYVAFVAAVGVMLATGFYLVR